MKGERGRHHQARFCGLFRWRPTSQRARYSAAYARTVTRTGHVRRFFERTVNERVIRARRFN